MVLSSNRSDLAEMFMPCPFDRLAVLLDDFGQLSELGSRILTVPFDFHERGEVGPMLDFERANVTHTLREPRQFS